MRGLKSSLGGLQIAIIAIFSQSATGDDLRSATVAISVVDDEGRPVQGATVRVLGEPAGVSPATTDASGLCRVPRPLGIETNFNVNVVNVSFLAETEGDDGRPGHIDLGLKAELQRPTDCACDFTLSDPIELTYNHPVLRLRGVTITGRRGSHVEFLERSFRGVL